MPAKIVLRNLYVGDGLMVSFLLNNGSGRRCCWRRR